MLRNALFTWIIVSGMMILVSCSVQPIRPPSPQVSSPTATITTTIIKPAEFPTPLSIDPADYEGWWTYTNDAFGFSLLLPPDWVVDETTTGDPLMNGHLLNLHPEDAVEKLNIRMSFRHVGEELLLWPTGVGEGEFVPAGTLSVAGQPAQRLLFECPSGQIGAIWFHQSAGQANIQRGNLEFGFIFGFTGATCQEGHNLSGKVQRVGEMIISSLHVSRN